MKDPIVTIIVPAYRRLHYLREAVASALKQTYQDFEIILSDDSASDEIAHYAASLGDARVRYRRNPKNLGIARNNFAAISEARGRYIASLHDDDMWEPEFLAKLVPPLEADSEISVAFCDHHLIDEQGNLLPERTESCSRLFGRDILKPGRHQPFIRPAVVDMTIPMAMAAIFRKSMLENAEIPHRIGGSYDYWLAYLAVKDGQACFYVPQRLTRYRVHENSGSNTRGMRNLHDAIYVRKKILSAPVVAPYRKNLENELGVFYGKMALQFLAHRSFRRGRIFLRRAFSLLNRPKSMAALVANTIRVLYRGTTK